MINANKLKNVNLNIKYVPVLDLKEPDWNPRVRSDKAKKDLIASVERFGIVDPLVVNSAKGREGMVLGGNFRLAVAKQLGFKEVPVVYIHIPDLKREKELCLRLNKNTGDWDINLLANFDESFLAQVGFTSEEIDEIFPVDENPAVFDLKRELEKLSIKSVKIQKGDLFDLDGSRLLCGDSTIESDVLKLMGEERADMCFTDPPYILNYLRGKKRNGKATEGFGLKRDRKYLETDELPPDFTEKWMANIAKIQKPDFSIIVYENPKNLRIIWNEIEKHWKYRNTIVWHLVNRVQGFAAKYKFFNKSDIALVGTKGKIKLNLEQEPDELLQNEYENAIYATSGKPQWEPYEKGKKICPTDFVEFKAADEKSSGQGIIFGTKPLEILVPYIKVLTKRGDLIVEPFGGSGSTLIAANKLNRRCFVMEKCPTYAEVIKNRWEKISGKEAKKIS